ncbi:MAG: asparagine synthetase B, partial [Bacteroidota bacterium]
MSESCARVQAMCDALAHGGPDDSGIFADENARLVFGHRRLSIIDLSRGGHQPMTDVTKRAWITFNGEIYNYQELRTELQAYGFGFNSGSDTEVILAAYLRWGTASFGKLRGMFAFALYDAGSLKTYLVRDAAGIKPLYYSAKPDWLAFASEIRAFKSAEPDIETDRHWQVRFLAYGHIPEPFTTLKDVFCLEKKHFLTWDHQNNNFTIGK